MSFLDKLFGRGKKAADDAAGDDSMKREGMQQEAQGMQQDAQGMAGEGAEKAEDVAQEARDQAAEHHVDRTDTP